MTITLSNPNPESDIPLKCTKAQRQYIDLKLRKTLWLDYVDILKICRQEFLRDVKDISQLSLHEANIIIRLLERKITNRGIR